MGAADEADGGRATGAVHGGRARTGDRRTGRRGGQADGADRCRRGTDGEAATGGGDGPRARRTERGARQATGGRAAAEKKDLGWMWR